MEPLAHPDDACGTLCVQYVLGPAGGPSRQLKRMATTPPPPELQESYSVTPQQVEQFQRDGFIRLKGVFSADTLARYTGTIQAEVTA